MEQHRVLKVMSAAGVHHAARLPCQKKMSTLLEYVAATAGLESNGRVRAVQNYFATEFAKPTGINGARAAVFIGMARRTCRPPPHANHYGRRIASADPPSDSYARINSSEVRMKTLCLATSALALVVAADLALAGTQGPKPSGDNAWQGISQRVDGGSANAVTTPHYEYQYGYVHRGEWRGQWVLVR